jgi:glutamine amidotransferase
MLAIIDYGSGNLRSVAKALERVAEGRIAINITKNADDLKKASHIILPGVGAFADCMHGLKSLPDMIDAMEEEVHTRGKWFLGICVGMQMLFERGYEHGVHTGLGWLKGEVKPLVPRNALLKVPHMGWNELKFSVSHTLLHGLKNGDHAYFVHSYHALAARGSDVIATTEYGETITAAVAHGHIMGTQFHPEKSQQAGLTLLKNFIML